MNEDARAESAASRTVSTTVRPLTAAEAVLLLEDPDAFTRATGLHLADGYLAVPQALSRITAGVRAGESPQWGSQLVIDPVASAVVGLGGFKGPPGDTGTVEVGYSIAPAHQRRGHARCAVTAWVGQAATAGVDAVIAHTLAETNASTRVLEHCGFTMVTGVPDDEMGEIWQWRIDLTAQRAAVNSRIVLSDALELARNTHDCTLTTVRPDGRPHLTNVLQVLGPDGSIRISTPAGSVKYTNLRWKPWAAVHVNGPDFWSNAVIEGDVTLSAPASTVDDPVTAELMDHYRAMQGEPADWHYFQALMIKERRVVVRLHPDRAYGFRLPAA